MKRIRQGKRLWNEKAAFEQMQSELEIITEQMSDIVARSHLRATQTQILFLTIGASERRNEFANLIFTLNNEEKKRKQFGSSRASRNAALATAGSGIQYATSAPAAGTFVVRGIANAMQGEGSDSVAERQRQQQQAHESVRDALLASLEAFMTNTESQPMFVARVDSETDGNSDADEDDGGQFRSWACSACTYMNSSGRRCAMCGTPTGN